jgi:hypothetical protein
MRVYSVPIVELITETLNQPSNKERNTVKTRNGPKLLVRVVVFQSGKKGFGAGELRKYFPCRRSVTSEITPNDRGRDRKPGDAVAITLPSSR